MNLVPNKASRHGGTKDFGEGDNLRLGSEGQRLGHAGGEGCGVLDHVYGLVQVVLDLVRRRVTAVVKKSRERAKEVDSPLELATDLSEHVGDVGHEQVETLLGQQGGLAQVPDTVVLVHLLRVESFLLEEMVAQEGNYANVVVGAMGECFKILISILLEEMSFIISGLDQWDNINSVWPGNVDYGGLSLDHNARSHDKNGAPSHSIKAGAEVLNRSVDRGDGGEGE